MKKILFLFFSFVFFLPSCKKGDELSYEALQNSYLLKGEIQLIQLGYRLDTDAVGRNFENEERFQDAFISFYDTSAVNGRAASLIGNNIKRNRFEYSEDIRELEVRVYPKGVAYESISVVSSDSDIVEVVSVADGKVKVRTGKFGDTNLKVTVVGKKNTVIGVYPMRVAAMVDMQFTIPSFWLSEQWSDRTVVRYKIKSLPAGMKDLVTEVIDSVSVIGYCEYYDFKKSRSPFVLRDTINFSRQDRVDRFRKNHRVLLRNITPAVDEIQKRKTEGNYKTKDENGNVIYPRKDYRWIVEQVVVNFLVMCDNPFVEFNLESRCSKIVKTADGDGTEESEEEEERYVDDGGSENDLRELEKTEKSYLVLVMNDFLDDAQRDSLSAGLNHTLDSLGYKQNLSDEDKDKALDEINKHKEEDE